MAAISDRVTTQKIAAVAALPRRSKSHQRIDSFDRLVARDPERALEEIPRITGSMPCLRAVPFYKKLIANQGPVGVEALEKLVRSYRFAMRENYSLEHEALFYLDRLIERKPSEINYHFLRLELALDLVLRTAFGYGKDEWMAMGHPIDVAFGEVNVEAENRVLEEICFVVNNCEFFSLYNRIVELCESLEPVAASTRAVVARVNQAVGIWLLKEEGSQEQRAEARLLFDRTSANQIS